MWEILDAFTLATHLMCLNISVGAPLLAIVAQRPRIDDDAPDASRMARVLVKSGLHALLAGALLGLCLVAIAWLRGNAGFFAVLPSFQYKLAWGFAELLFYAACLVVYLWLLPVAGRASRARSTGMAILAILASTNLLYHFPPLFTSIHRASLAPSDVPAHVGRLEFRAMLVSGYVIPLTVHFGLASIAASGIFAWQWAYAQSRSRETIPRTWQHTARWGARLALVATAIQIGVGMWLLLSIPAASQRALLGDDWFSATCLGLSVFATLGLLQAIAGGALQSQLTSATAAFSWLASITLLMTMVLRRL